MLFLSYILLIFCQCYFYYDFIFSVIVSKNYSFVSIIHISCYHFVIVNKLTGFQLHLRGPASKGCEGRGQEGRDGYYHQAHWQYDNLVAPLSAVCLSADREVKVVQRRRGALVEVETTATQTTPGLNRQHSGSSDSDCD